MVNYVKYKNLVFVRFFNNFTKKDKFFFKLGIFFIPSAFAISAIFIIPSLLIQSFKKGKSIFQDKYNLLLFSIGALMILSCIVQNSYINGHTGFLIEKYLTWIGLFNWITFFWIFSASQDLLKTKRDRISFSYLLTLGTIPVIVSGLGQYFLNWIGPFKILNGFVIWYQRPINEISGLTGLFNHANYAGSWLTIILPLCIAQIFDNSKNKYKSYLLSIILLGIIICIFLTNSRNAWGSSLLTLPIIFGLSSLWWFIPFSLFLATLILITTNNIFKGALQDFLRNLLPNKVWLEFTQEGFKRLDVSRFEILNEAKNIILNNLFFGTGAGSFPLIYEINTGFWKGHAHNIFAELAISYGLPSTILFIYFLFKIFIISFRKIFKDPINNIIDKSIWAASFIFILSQMVDIQYFDGRISLVFWLLIAGLKCSIDENNEIN